MVCLVLAFVTVKLNEMSNAASTFLNLTLDFFKQ